MTDAASPFWVPERLLHDLDPPACRWLMTAGVRFTDPFFESTISRCRQHGSSRRATSLADLHAIAAEARPVPPAAFIFHVSRCGSTLFSQLLALDPRVVVLSEAPALDDALRAPAGMRAALFADALRLLGRQRFGDEERLFVKTDSWHIFHAPLLRGLYPDVPFILLYRAPEPVLRSHRRARGRHMVPGLIDADLLGVAPYDPAQRSLDQYAADILARYYAALLDFAAQDSRALLVSHDEGFPAAFFRACAAIGLSLTADQQTDVTDRCRFHGKRPQDAFVGDADAALEAIDLAAAQALYERLDAARCA